MRVTPWNAMERHGTAGTGNCYLAVTYGAPLSLSASVIATSSSADVSAVSAFPSALSWRDTHLQAARVGVAWQRGNTVRRAASPLSPSPLRLARWRLSARSHAHSRLGEQARTGNRTAGKPCHPSSRSWLFLAGEDDVPVVSPARHPAFVECAVERLVFLGSVRRRTAGANTSAMPP